jgi:hypothetical protein
VARAIRHSQFGPVKVLCDLPKLGVELVTLFLADLNLFEP